MTDSAALFCVGGCCIIMVLSTFGLIVPYAIYAFNNPDIQKDADGYAVMDCYVEPGSEYPVPYG